MPVEHHRYASWQQRLKHIDEANQRRVLKTLAPISATTVSTDRGTLLLACSNDYLGLASDTRIQEAARGTGAGSSRLIAGDRPAHRALEEALADLYGRPALTFVSGYQANLAVFSTACEAGQLIASDELNHASIIDGLRLSRAKKQIVPHLRPDAVAEEADLIAVEGLFSMDGDCPTLVDYPRAPLMALDEAHAFGALGPEGRGVGAMQSYQPDILIGTFGKACGASGAFVSAPQTFIDLLINRGRSFIYTTAAPEPVAQMALAGLKIMRGADDLRETLAQRTQQLRRGLQQLGWETLGAHHIVPVLAGERAMELGERLIQRGVLAPAIRYPTVALGQERIRLTVSAAHSHEQIDRILDAFGDHTQWT